MGTPTVVNMVAVQATTGGNRDVVDKRELKVIEDAGNEVEFDEDCFVKSVDLRRVSTDGFEQMLASAKVEQGDDDSKKVDGLQKSDKMKDDARIHEKTVTDRETEYQTQVSNGDAEVISSFGILMTGAQDREHGLTEEMPWRLMRYRA